VLLIAPEIVELWCWFVAKAEEHAVRRDERIYRFGYTDIRMLMVDGNPWFAADDVGGALGFANVSEETRLFDVAHCNFVGDELYLSAAGVAVLMGLSRHPDARSFRLWFEREVMIPLNRAREGRAGDALLRRSGS
jgi:prophage antirepressor-like protein